MAKPTGYAHAATLAGGADLAVTLAGQLREAQEAIQRVRALHVEYRNDEYLVHYCETCGGRWPCPTISALDPPDGTSWCKCDDCWGWFVEDHPGEDLDALGADRSWWSGLPEHRSRPPDGAS